MNGNALPQCLVNFSEYMRKNQGKSQDTITNYIGDLIQLLRFLKHKKTKAKINVKAMNIISIDYDFLRDITKQDLFDFIKYLDDDNKCNNSKARKISSIKQFFKYLSIQIDVLSKDVSKALEVPQKEERQPIFLNLTEQKQLLNTIKNSKDIENVIQDYTIISLALVTGMRVSELSSLNINSFNLEYNNNYIRVIGKRNKERFINLNQDYVDSILNKYFEYRDNILDINKEDKNALFINKHHNRMQPRSIENMVKKYVEIAGINKHITPHKLRHTLASNMVNSTDISVLDLKEMLGHKDINTTTIYTHLNNKKIKDAVTKNPINDFIKL